jgi:hypothetical protein
MLIEPAARAPVREADAAEKAPVSAADGAVIAPEKAPVAAETFPVNVRFPELSISAAEHTKLRIVRGVIEPAGELSEKLASIADRA